MRCHCGSDLDFERCCGPFLSGDKNPPTAEALMRSRYVAYARGDIDYIARTLAPEKQGTFDAKAATAWATQAKWLGLKILFVEGGGQDDVTGVVSFIATYRQDGQTIEHHEVSQFGRRHGDTWRFVEGDTSARIIDGGREGAARSAAKIGRNDPCPCGSGKKYKKCCGA